MPFLTLFAAAFGASSHRTMRVVRLTVVRCEAHSAVSRTNGGKLFYPLYILRRDKVVLSRIEVCDVSHMYLKPVFYAYI